MSDSVTRLTILTTIRERLDMVGSTFITDTEFNGWIDNSTRKLYDLLVDARGEDYYTAKTTFSTVAGTSDYALNTICGSNQFYKLRGIYLVNGSNRLSMSKIGLDDAVTYSARVANSIGWSSTLDPSDVSYCVFGDTLRFCPTPQAVYTCEIWYIPPFVGYSSDSSTVDAVNGWDDYIIADVCCKGGSKEEADISVFMSEKQEAMERIARCRNNRDRYKVLTVRDVQRDGWRRYY